jgi:hypothetical protein
VKISGFVDSSLLMWILSLDDSSSSSRTMCHQKQDLPYSGIYGLLIVFGCILCNLSCKDFKSDVDCVWTTHRIFNQVMKYFTQMVSDLYEGWISRYGSVMTAASFSFYTYMFGFQMKSQWQHCFFCLSWGLLHHTQAEPCHGSLNHGTALVKNLTVKLGTM